MVECSKWNVASRKLCCVYCKAGQRDAGAAAVGSLGSFSLEEGTYGLGEGKAGLWFEKS